ncbi:uncharacterized protein LOC108087542 [Drosophila ficusphila]|uniref:uncharacterized protein LOC108087542 n=1 Tax=Drosophila ficusphila TaxID=30025 RepID=UPI0007E6DC9E|nr:uncharacterized protein LOC108087542 [Drosophila ficusphila]
MEKQDPNEGRERKPPPGAPGLRNSDSVRSPPPAAAPRRPKPGILRLDIGKPRRSSGGSVDFRCVGSSSTSNNNYSNSNSNVATGANSEVSEHDLRPARECLRFGLANDDVVRVRHPLEEWGGAEDITQLQQVLPMPLPPPIAINTNGT